ncbi:MAG: hypothetical protein MZW92_70355 [Comamonadaceae bacterium]|nr:hypothetical protein [Comamonadaceae bacterium]
MRRRAETSTSPALRSTRCASGSRRGAAELAAARRATSRTRAQSIALHYRRRATAERGAGADPGELLAPGRRGAARVRRQDGRQRRRAPTAPDKADAVLALVGAAAGAQRACSPATTSTTRSSSSARRCTG